MSEQQNFGFGKFVPGFDFLQNLAKGTSQSSAAVPNLASWVAPTLNVEELDKRIGELKAVSFWLDQNAKALAATIQALELQKMTLATLKGMNFNMAEVANALQLKPAEPVKAQVAGEGAAASTGSVAGAAKEAVAKARASNKSGTQGTAGSTGQQGAPAAGVVDPLQWWGALTQQFQEIAAGAMQEAAKNPALASARELAGGVTGQAMKAVTEMAAARSAGRKAPAAGKSAGAKAAPRKTGARGR